jgi:hypothetical protein
VVAHEQDDKTLNAVRRVRDVSLLTYDITFTLNPDTQIAVGLTAASGAGKWWLRR